MPERFENLGYELEDTKPEKPVLMMMRCPWIICCTNYVSSQELRNTDFKRVRIVQKTMSWRPWRANWSNDGLPARCERNVATDKISCLFLSVEPASAVPNPAPGDVTAVAGR